MYFNRFDICEAYYVYASEYHRGQWSEEYRIFGRLNKIGFKPRRSLDSEYLEDNAREIFEALVEKHEASH